MAIEDGMTPEQLAMLGRMSDRSIAIAVGTDNKTIAALRLRLGIPAPPPTQGKPQFRTCKICGVTFLAKSHLVRYCSLKCKRRANVQATVRCCEKAAANGRPHKKTPHPRAGAPPGRKARPPADKYAHMLAMRDKARATASAAVPADYDGSRCVYCHGKTWWSKYCSARCKSGATRLARVAKLVAESISDNSAKSG